MLMHDDIEYILDKIGPIDIMVLHESTPTVVLYDQFCDSNGGGCDVTMDNVIRITL